MEKSYRKTLWACYAANIIQSIVINVTPLLFVYLKAAYGLCYTQFGTLVLANFGIQVAVDLACSRAVDRHGYRPFLVSAHILCTVGFCLFALTPQLFPGHEFSGFLFSTALFSGAGGLFELLLSPIVAALPCRSKTAQMSLLHSTYAWGKLGCIFLTTAALFIGIPWYCILLGYAVLPLCNAAIFAKVYLPQTADAATRMPCAEMLISPVFLLAFLAIFFGGAAEVTMSQWSSTLLRDGLGMPKLWGDLIGVGGFSFFLGLGRLLHGLYGEKLNLSRLLIGGCLLAAGGYCMVAAAPMPWAGAAACAMTGLFVSILWPGTLALSARWLPKAGTALFALLAAAGDLGGALGPWLVGKAADLQIVLGRSSADSLKQSALFAALFPLAAALFQWQAARYAGRRKSKK